MRRCVSPGIGDEEVDTDLRQDTGFPSVAILSATCQKFRRGLKKP